MITIMMVADTVAVTAAKGLGVLRAYQSTCNFSVADQISAMIQTYDAVAPPPVKPTTYRLRRRTLLRRKQLTKRRLSGDDSGDAGNEGFLFGDGGDGPFGGGGVVVVVGILIDLGVGTIGMNLRLRCRTLRSISCIRCCRGLCSRIACIFRSRGLFELLQRGRLWIPIGKRFPPDWFQFADLVPF
ncbi:hypothetical protein glysoja_004363 [Glycine soja]|nr:hypothetical protein glysoja_004363 [Glycine soja]